MRSWRGRLQTLSQPTACFLPDFGSPEALFLLIVSVELLAVVLALAPRQNWANFWIDLTNISFLCQSIALLSAGGLYYLRPWLGTLRTPHATLAIYGLTQAATILVTLLTLWPTILNAAGTISLTDQSFSLGRNLAISGIITLIALRYFYVQHQWKQNVEAETRSRLWALQARIHPHFLFNTLNTIAGLIRAQPDRAEQVVLDLADLLRSALASLERITLGEEIELTRRYLAIERLRMGERLRVDWQLDDGLPLDAPLPALLLQPLVENAIHHGIQPLPEGGQLAIRIEKQSRALRIVITNPRPPAGGQRNVQGQQLAQDNIRQRLLLVYGAASQLEITETPDSYRVAFAVPLSD